MTRPARVLWITVIVTILVMAAALFAALFAAGAGHGSYLPAAALFPFGTAGAMTSHNGYTAPLAVTLVVLQFPAYILHAVAAIACIFWMQNAVIRWSALR